MAESESIGLGTSDDLYVFLRARSTLHKAFREFHRHFKFLQPLDFDF